MFKFLRKYNTWILAVGGSLLVIVFLIPQALSGLAERAAVRGVSWGTLGGEKLTAVDRNRAEAELGQLDGTPLMQYLQQVIGLERPEHWYMLSLEAQAAGLTTGPAAIDPDSVAWAPYFARRGPREREFMRATIAKFTSVQQLLGLYQAGSAFSDRRMLRYAQREVLSVDAMIVAIPASGDPEGLSISESDLQTQLDTYGDVIPGEGDRGFGYRLPNRFKLEWMTIDAESVRDAIDSGGEIDDVALRKHWRRREGVGGIPAIESGVEVPDIVRQDLLDERTTERLREIKRYASNQLRQRLRSRSPVGGFYELDDAWADERMPFPELADELQTRFGIDRPSYQASGDEWMTFEDLAADESLGQASTTEFGTGVQAISTVVSSIREFGESGTMPAQAGIALPAFDDLSGDVIFARVVGTDASRAPTSIDEVRDQLVEDMARQQRYDSLAATVDAMERTARTDGMLALALEQDSALNRSQVFLRNPSLLQIVLQNDGFNLALNPSQLPEIGEDRKTVERIIDHCLAIPEGVALEDLPIEDRIFALAVPDRLAVLVVEITNVTPLTRELYDLMLTTNNASGNVRALIQQGEVDLLEDLQATFGYDAMSERYDFVLASPPTADTVDESADDTADEPTTP